MSEKRSVDRPDLVSDPTDVTAEDRVTHLETGSVADVTAVQTDREAPGSDVSDELLIEDDDRADSWLHYNKGLEETGYSPADQLTPDNIDGLERVWTYETGSGGLEVNPIVVPGDPPVMYISTTNQHVVALNARTGERYWEFAYGDASSSANRGVAVWGDKVYLGASSVELVAIDRYTGEAQWATQFLSQDQLENTGEYIYDAIGHTAAPLVYDGKVFLGQAGDSGAWAALSAIDAESGDVRWQRTTAPRDEWVGETWRYASNAAWMNPVVDAETNSVMFPVGNPNPQHGVTNRPGPNRDSNSIVALDADSGEVNWKYQILPHDLWDYDVCTTPHLLDVEVGGESRRAVLQNHKSGWSFLIDAETGELLERSEPWDGTRQDHWGEGFLVIPPFAPVPQPDSAEVETQEIFWPSAAGATEWPPDAYSRQTGLQYISVTEGASTIYHNPEWEYDPERDATITLRAGDHIYLPPEDLDQWSNAMYAGQEYTAGIAAVNPATGENEWYQEIARYDDRSAFGSWPGGATATAGNLVFIGASDGELIAYNAESGNEVWRDETQLRITASPVVWDDPAQETEYVSVSNSENVYGYAYEY
jgi:PQQ-dependent dehydrogenase (methanol/ethanol family)